MAKRFWLQPAEVDLLVGDYSSARGQLGWEQRTRFVDLVKQRVEAVLEMLHRHRQNEIRVSRQFRDKKC